MEFFNHKFNWHNELYDKLQHIVRKNWNALWLELSESKELMVTLYRIANGHKLTEEEFKNSWRQATDIIKIIPALGIFLLPGGAVMLIILAKIMPWDLVPSTFKEELQEEIEIHHKKLRHTNE